MLCFPQINLVFQTQLLSQLFSCAFLSSNHLVFFFEPNYFPNPTFFIFLLSSKSTCFQTQLFSQPFFLSAFCSSESQCYIHTKNICYVCICMHIHSKYDIWLILQAWTRKAYVKYPAGGASCWRTSSRTWRETILAYTCKLPWNLVQGAKTCFIQAFCGNVYVQKLSDCFTWKYGGKETKSSQQGWIQHSSSVTELAAWNTDD